MPLSLNTLHTLRLSTVAGSGTGSPLLDLGPVTCVCVCVLRASACSFGVIVPLAMFLHLCSLQAEDFEVTRLAELHKQVIYVEADIGSKLKQEAVLRWKCSQILI